MLEWKSPLVQSFLVAIKPTMEKPGQLLFALLEGGYLAFNYDTTLFDIAIEDKNLDDVINAPMHGIVKYKNLKPNIKVKKGDVLLSLEAMKMEYSLTCPRNGIIEEIHVKDGQQASEGMELLTLKKDLNDG